MTQSTFINTHVLVNITELMQALFITYEGEFLDDLLNLHQTKECWIVSNYLGSHLINHSETVGKMFGLTIWGRTCSDPVSIDNVICDIYNESQN